MTNTDWELIKGVRKLRLGEYSSRLNAHPFLKEFQTWQLGLTCPPPQQPLFKAWNEYEQAHYAKASELASHIILDSSSEPFIHGFATLLMAKITSDCGYSEAAQHYARKSFHIGMLHEIHELLSAASGALGEIFLRAGQPLRSIEMFELDDSLLAVGSKWKGRILCYKAHAYARLGCLTAARLAYRDAEYRPGEHSRPFVLAGLALLAIHHDLPLPSWLPRLIDTPELQTARPAHGWLHWAYAYYQQDSAPQHLNIAANLFGSLYAAENHFIHAWARAQSIPLLSREAPLTHLVLPNEITSYICELPVLAVPHPIALNNSGIATICWSDNQKKLLQQRLAFMP